MRLIAFVAISIVACASSGAAQGIEPSTVVGTVTDSTGAVVPDAVVVLQSPDLIGGPRRVVTDRQGAYRIALLTSGTYAMTVSRDGFEPARRTDIRLPGEKTLTVDFELHVAGIGETVGVRVKPPLIDVTSAAAPIVLDRDLLENLPTDRTLANIMNLVPGVNVSAGFGGTQQSNPVYVDGVNTTDAQQLAPKSTFNYNWIQEIQVAALGANAEYGDFSGVVQTNTLRSGSNRLSGLAEYRTTRPRWVGTNTSSLAASVQAGFIASPQRLVAWHDANAQLGGPIVTDRLWYFGGFQHFTNNTHPALVAGDDSVDERDRRTLAKITSAPRAALRVEGFYEFDRYHLTNDGLSPTVRPEATTTDTLPNHNWNTRATWVLGARTTFELRNSGLTGTYTFDAPAPGTRSGPSGHVDLSTGIVSVNAPNYFDYGTSRNVVAAALNRYADAPGGRHHDVKVGTEFERARERSVSGYPGERFYRDLNQLPFQVLLRKELEQSATIHRTAAYAQDSWAVTDRLTLQAGLRAAFNRGLVSQGGVFSTHPIDPRAGAAWDVAGTHKTLVRAHYGRYHDALLTAHFQSLDEAPPPPLITARVVGPDQFVEISRSTSQNNYRVDPDVSSAYFDQYVVGVERELWPQWSMTAQVVRRNYENLAGTLDIGSVYEPLERRDPGPDGRLNTADDGGILTVYRNTNTRPALYYLTNPLGAYRRYSAVQVIARKLYANNWQLQASYAWSSTRGNIDNSWRSNAGGPENGFNGPFADPNRAINADGPTPFDFTHEIKALGTWRLPLWGGINISGVYQYHTGLAWARSVLSPQLGGLQFVTFGVRAEPRGSRRTAALSQLDARVEKTLPLRGTGRLGVFADIFNVNNQGVPDPSKLFAVEFRSGATFGQPLNWNNPRTLRAGVRLMF